MNKFDATRRLYNKYAFKFADKFERIPEVQQLDEFIKLLPKRAKVLDLGCGSGRDADYLTKADLDVIGVDLSEKLIYEAKKRHTFIDFRVMNIEELVFLENNFDGVWSKLAILHVDREILPIVLKSVYTVLKPNGLLMIETKSGSGEGVEQLNFSKEEERYFVYYQLNELIEIFEKAGFADVTGYEYSVDNKHETKNKDRIVVAGRKI